MLDALIEFLRRLIELIRSWLSSSIHAISDSPFTSTLCWLPPEFYESEGGIGYLISSLDYYYAEHASALVLFDDIVTVANEVLVIVVGAVLILVAMGAVEREVKKQNKKEWEKRNPGKEFPGHDAIRKQFPDQTFSEDMSKRYYEIEAHQKRRRDYLSQESGVWPFYNPTSPDAAPANPPSQPSQPTQPSNTTSDSSHSDRS
jgi:hypothetical protein